MQSKTLYYLYSLDIQNKNLLYSLAKMEILIKGEEHLFLWQKPAEGKSLSKLMA